MGSSGVVQYGFSEEDDHHSRLGKLSANPKQTLVVGFTQIDGKLRHDDNDNI